MSRKCAPDFGPRGLGFVFVVLFAGCSLVHSGERHLGPVLEDGGDADLDGGALDAGSLDGGRSDGGALDAGGACAPLDDPANGSVTVVDGFATYACDEHYHRRGPSRRECQADGTWSVRAPRCGRWVEEALPGDYSFVAFAGLWGRSSGDVWVVGQGGVTLRRTGGTWTEAPYCCVDLGDANWEAIWGPEIGGDFVAGGSYGDDGATQGLVRLGDGAAWTAPPVNPEPRVLGIHGNDEALFLVGEDGALAARLPGPVLTSGANMSIVTLRGVWSQRSGATAWAVGDDGVIVRLIESASEGFEEVVERSGGATLHGIWGFSDDDGVAEEILAVGANGAVLRRRGSVWENVRSAGHTLRAIWGSASDDLWAVGHQGTVLHYDGSEWSELVTPTDHRLNAVWGRGHEVWAAGAEGTFLRWSED